MDFPKDMMEELLLRLSLKAITKFKCVSKYWNNFISGPEFRRWYQSRHPNVSPNGFVYHPIRSAQEQTVDMEPAKFVYTSKINKEEFSLCHDLQEFGKIVGSSKGLLLLIPNFFSRPSTVSCFYVYDLLTRNHLQLPKKPPQYCKYIVTGIICREHEQNASKIITGSSSYLTYKIVVIGCHHLEEKTTYQIETYSSEGEKWNKSVMTTASAFEFNPMMMATTIGDVLYWKSYSSKYILAYDPENPMGHAKLIEFPILEQYGKVTISGIQDESLLFMIESYWSKDVEVWHLAKEKYFDDDIIKCGCWNLLHKSSYVEREQSLLVFRGVKPAFIECIGIYNQDPSIIILKLSYHEFISYNLNDKKVETIVLKEDGTESLPWVTEYLRFEYPKWPCLY